MVNMTPQPDNNYIKSDIKLTIGMLVSNHIEHIEKCLEALKPLLDSVKSELVILDTVGPEKSDGSIDVCRKYTDKIYRFEWVDDFSAARNELLKHASGEWFMYQDDDEWFEDVTEFIDFFNGPEAEIYHSGSYYVLSYLPDGRKSKAVAGRIIRRKPDTCFVGKVHEHFNKWFLPNKEFKAFTNHMGYCFMDDAARERHFERNMKLLNEELAEKGPDSGIISQMVLEYYGSPEKAEEGLAFCKKYVEELANPDEDKDSCYQWLLVAVIRGYANTGTYEEMLKASEELFRTHHFSWVGKLAACAVICGQAAVRKDIPVFFQYFPDYLECYDLIKANPEVAVRMTNLDLPKFYEDDFYHELLWFGAAFANSLKEYELSLSMWNRMGLPSMKPEEKARYAADIKETLGGLKK